MDKPIFVTQPSLPPLEELILYLEQISASGNTSLCWQTRELVLNATFVRNLKSLSK